MYNFSKIIIWGHKLHSHTHSYIHYALFKAFKHLNYNVFWFDNNDDVSNFDFSNSLFITEHQVEEKIPVRKDCKYVSYVTSVIPCEVPHPYVPNLHIDVYKYETIKKLNKKKEYFFEDDKSLIQPWGTSLLPHEFDFEKALSKRLPEAYFFGTVIDAIGWNGNYQEVKKFEDSCNKYNIKFDYRGLYTKGFIDEDFAINKLQCAYAAPVIQGTEQIESGYLPCRLFKNISCGHYATTNSKAVYDVFKNLIPELIYDFPENILFKIQELNNKDVNKKILFEQMNYVKNNHTYINIISNILGKL